MNDSPRLAEILKVRRQDYDTRNLTEERRQLVALWRQHHPEAAQESSAALHPLMLIGRKHKSDPPDEPDEVWANDVYQVTLRRKEDLVFGTHGGMIQLGINALDGTARQDWREFQAIKNQLAGPECESFELYPAESRLLDPSNYYTLWCFPGLKRIKVGVDYRRVYPASEALAPQRALAEESAEPQ